MIYRIRREYANH